MRVEGFPSLSTSVRSADVDAELTTIVVETVIIDAEEELPVCRHLDADAAADRERLAIHANTADQRAREHIRKRRVRSLASGL